MSGSNRTGGRYSATLLEIFKWIFGYFAPPIVGIVLVVLSDNYIGAKHQMWLVSAGLALIWSWVVFFSISRIPVESDAEPIVTIGISVVEFVAAVILVSALIAGTDFQPIPILFGVHLILFAAFRTIRRYFAEKRFVPGGFSVAYLVTGATLIGLALIV